MSTHWCNLSHCFVDILNGNDAVFVLSIGNKWRFLMDKMTGVVSVQLAPAHNIRLFVHFTARQMPTLNSHRNGKTKENLKIQVSNIDSFYENHCVLRSLPRKLKNLFTSSEWKMLLIWKICIFHAKNVFIIFKNSDDFFSSWAYYVNVQGVNRNDSIRILLSLHHFIRLIRCDEMSFIFNVFKHLTSY